MLKVTDRAANALQDLSRAHQAEGQMVRLVPRDSGTLGMQMDAPHDGDEVITRQEAPLVAVDHQVAQTLAKSVLDFGPDDQTGQLAFHVTAGD